MIKLIKKKRTLLNKKCMQSWTSRFERHFHENEPHYENIFYKITCSKLKPLLRFKICIR